MKKLSILLLITLFSFACSSDDNCKDEVAEINAGFDDQIEWVQNNTNPIDTGQIDLLNEERALRLQQACN